jgi:hypothetical protein
MNALLRYGTLAGVLISLMLFAPYFIFGARPEWMRLGEVVGYTSMILCMSATWFAMRREHERRGTLGYGAALAVGTGVSAIAGLLFGIATWVFYSLVGDALPEALIAFYAQQISDAGLPAAETARRMQELESMRPLFFNRPLQGAVMAATVFVIGAIESLGFAWVVSRRGRAAPAHA